MDFRRCSKTPLLDIWAPILEFIIMLKTRKKLQLDSLFSAFTVLDFASLSRYFFMTGALFLLSAAAMFYLAVNWINAFLLVSCMLFVGAFVHFGAVEMGLDHEYIVAYIALFGLACGISLLSFNRYFIEIKRRSLVESARVLRQKVFDVSLALGVSMVTIFSFLVLYSQINTEALSGGEALLLNYLKIAALCSLVYKFRFTTVILMTAASADDLGSYVKMIIRRIKFIGTIFLAGMLRPLALAMWMLRTLFNCIVLFNVNISDHTLISYELGVFYSAMNNVSFIEGQRLAGSHDRCKLPIFSQSFSFFPSIFYPSCIAMVHIFSTLTGMYVPVFSSALVALHLAILYLLFMELLYSVVVVKLLLEREKKEDAILNAIVVNDKEDGESTS
jgi:hypothetical protein